MTQLIIQDLTVWLCEVATETKDDSWSNDVGQPILPKEGQQHAPKVSTPAILWMAWARSHCCSLAVGLFHLDLQKQDPARHKDELPQLYILTPLRFRSLKVAHNAAVGGHFEAAKTCMAMRQHFFWPGMWKAMQEYIKCSDTRIQVNQQAGNAVSLQQPLLVAQGCWECMGVDFITEEPIS